jgi:hypothetical protein
MNAGRALSVPRKKAHDQRVFGPSEKEPDLVGIFVADTIEEHWVTVDECTDVDACEYALLPSGGGCRRCCVSQV